MVHRNILAGIVCFLLVNPGFSQDVPLVMDGQFDDWRTVPVRASDPINDALRQDLAELKVANDQEFLYLFLRFHTRDQLLQDWNDIHLYIDTDNSTGTGSPIHGIGADLAWCFGCREGVFHAAGEKQPFYQSDINLRIFPTLSSDTFEIAIDYRSPIFTRENQFRPDTIRLVLREVRDEGDYLPDHTGGVRYLIDSTRVMPVSPIPLERIHSGDIRIVTYNTLQSGLRDPARQPGFRRILRALQPDVMAFQELFDERIDLRGIIEEWFPEQTWYVNQQAHSVAVVSRFPIRKHAILTRSERTLAALLELSEPWSGSLLVINSHLACCDNNRSRQQDADQIMGAIRDLQHGSGSFSLPSATPIIHAGDFNLVGYAQQLITLTTGDIRNEESFGPGAPPDWDGTPLTDLFSRHTAKRMGYTWRDDGSTFNPGKLDYILFSDSVIELGRHFILNTAALSDSTLQKYGLLKDDSQRVSDHYPRVIDIAGKNSRTQQELQGYPGEHSHQASSHEYSR
ncbi:MAG TPA: endonuclease/exonuclease/phosphatase family protein [bacterium]|nr:endonuclease/exonuclease/phosphatase family protein [bacterium]